MTKRLQRIFVACFAVAALGLGFWGYAVAGSGYVAGGGGNAANPWGLLEALRCLVASLGLLRVVELFQPGRDPWQLVIAQFAVPGAALFAVVQVYLSAAPRRTRTGKLQQRSGHTVVCGVGDVGMQVVQSLREARESVVAVDYSDDSPNAATCEKCGVKVLKGDAKNQQVLLAAGILNARTAVITTGSDSENLEIALQIKAIREAQPPTMASAIQVMTEMRSGWMQKRLIAGEKSSLSSPHADLRFFNPQSNAARMLMGRLRIPPAPEFEALTFVVVGFGAYGPEIVLHLIRCWPVPLGRTLKILVFDENAEEAKRQFAVAEPAAAALASIEFISASVAAGSPDLKPVVEGTLKGAGPLLGVALVLGEDDASLCAALEMRWLLDRDGSFHVPVYVRLEHYRQLGEVVLGAENVAGFRERLQIFGTLEETLSADVLLGSRLDRLARALHEDSRRRSHGQINPAADVEWDKLPEFAKASNRWRADHTPLLMELAGLRLVGDVRSAAGLPPGEAEIELLAQLEHRRQTIERKLTREAPEAGNGRFPEEWQSLLEEQQEQKRNEATHLPQVMAGLGIEALSARTIRMYGERLATAVEELDPILRAPQFVHCNLIVDLDDSDAVRFSMRAMDLPSLSVWLFSRETPPELLDRNAETTPGPRNTLIQRAVGWAPRQRVMLQTADDAAIDGLCGTEGGAEATEVGLSNQVA
jgi:TrkA-N domain